MAAPASLENRPESKPAGENASTQKKLRQVVLGQRVR
jgi:hypothetical protein